MLSMQRLTLMILLGAVITAPTLLLPASSDTQAVTPASAERDRTPPPAAIVMPASPSSLRLMSREVSIISQKNAALEYAMASLQDEIKALPADQQKEVFTILQQQNAQEFAQAPGQRMALGLLASPVEQPEKLYSFLAPSCIEMVQRFLATTSFGTEAIVTILENPQEKIVLQKFIAAFTKRPDRIEHFQKCIQNLELACHKYISPAQAKALQEAKIFNQLSKQDDFDATRNYNSLSDKLIDRIKYCTRKSLTAAGIVSLGCVGVSLGASAIGGTYTLGWLFPSILPYSSMASSYAGYTLSSLAPWTTPINMATSAYQQLTGSNPLAPDLRRNALNAATKLAPYLHPLGLSKDINEHSPLTMNNVYQLLRILRYVGTLDVAARIVSLKATNQVVSCNPEVHSSLEQAIQELQDISIPAAIRSSIVCTPLASARGIQLKNKGKLCKKQQAAFDWLICNTIIAQSFGYAINNANSTHQNVSLPQIKSMNFTALRHYVGTETQEVMHAVQIIA